MACDLRVASAGAFIVTAFANIGLSGDYGASWFLNRLLGQAKANELMFLSERVRADECQRLGLVNAIFDEDSFFPLKERFGKTGHKHLGKEIAA